MSSKAKLVGQAVLLGITAALVLFGLSYVAASFEFKRLSYILYWQGWGLQSMVPSPNIGTLERPLYEATPVHLAAFLAGLPLGAFIYSIAAFYVLSFLRPPNPSLKPTARSGAARLRS